MVSRDFDCYLERLSDKLSGWGGCGVVRGGGMPVFCVAAAIGEVPPPPPPLAADNGESAALATPYDDGGLINGDRLAIDIEVV